MKKRIFFIAVFYLLTFKSFSQDKGYIGLSDKGYVGLSVGASIPIGDFASKDKNNNSAGFATTGTIFDISFGYKLGKNFGISALYRGQVNPTDADAFAAIFQNQYPGISWTVDSKSWSAAGFLFGCYGSFPIGTSGQTSFETRALIGFLSATTPEINITGRFGTTSAWIRQSSATATSFSFLLGMGFKFNVGNKICLLTNLDYLGAKPEFTDIKITDSTGGSSVETVTQSLETINFSVGIGFRL